MPPRPFSPTGPRGRAPDTAADLGLYAAPVAFAAPALVALADPSPTMAAPAPLAGADAQGIGMRPADWTPAFGWGSDQQGLGSILSASIAPAPEPKVQVAAAGEPALDKHVVVHVGSAAPASAVPLTQIEPVARAEAQPADVQIGPAAPATMLADAHTGQLLNLAAGESPALSDAVGALAATAPGTVGALVGTVGETVANVVPAAIEIVGDALQTATGLVGGTLDGLLDGLGPVGGNDPLGGITTLIDLVSAEDLFGPPAPGAEPTALLGSTLDATDGLLDGLGLASDSDPAPHDVLLGIADPHAGGALGLLGHLTDDPI
jgi:hypothetical protein